VSHTVIYGLAGQELRHVMPSRVASATYEITDLRKAQDDPERVLASGAATVPAWSLTVDDFAGPSQPEGARVFVSATAGPAIGDTVVVTESDGSFEAFSVSAIELDDYLDASSLLAGSYDPGATVQSVTITAPVPPAIYDFEDALDDQRPLRVEWRYGLAVVTEPIQLVRQGEALASVGPALATARQGYPTLGVHLLEGLTAEQLAAYALKRVESDLVARRIDPASLMAGVQGEMLLAAKIVHEAAIRGYAPGMRPLDDFVAEAETDYSTQLEALVVGGAGGQTFQLDTEARASGRDTTYRNPIRPM
jgi:hypothetical protein